MIRRFLPICVFVLTLFASLAHAATYIPKRTWTSKKGHTLSAPAIRVEGDKVILERDNGQELPVPIDQLIEADQKLIKERFAEKDDKKDNKQDPKKDDKKDDEKDSNGPRVVGADKYKPQKDEDGNTIYLPYELGMTATDVEADKNLKINIYVPTTLRAGEKYSAMIILDPKGTHGMMNKFINAAEVNEMIIVTLPPIRLNGRPKHLQNDRNKHELYIDEERLVPYVKDTIRKLHRDFPIDTKRIYWAGVKDSVHLAIWAMDKTRTSGVFAVNGGGKEVVEPMNRHIYMTLCSPASRYRWDVATTFREVKGSSLAQLRFYNGEGWPSESQITESLLMMNGMFLLKHQSGTHELAAERYEKELMFKIDEYEGDTELLMPWLEFAEQYGLKDKENIKKLEKFKKDVLKDATAAKTQDGLEACTKILLRYYSKGWDGYKEDYGKKSVTSSIMKTAEKYDGTTWGDILTNLSKAH